MRKLNILIAGRCREALEFVQRTIDGHAGCQTSVRMITNGHTDPLYGIKHLPDLPCLFGGGHITKAEMCGFVWHGGFYYGVEDMVT